MKEGVNAAKLSRFYGYADDGQGGARGERARQMRRHPGRRDYHAEAALSRLQRELPRLNGGAVGGENVRFIGHAEAREHLGRLVYHGQVAVAAHYKPNFFHGVTSCVRGAE